MPADQPRCPRCGAPLHATLSGGLCAACLLGANLDLDVADDEELLLDADPPFRTITILARDAHATTYLAEPFGTTRRVALGVYANRSDVRDVLARFAAWRKRVSLQRYPGVARVIDVGAMSASAVYLAAEYVAGPSLDTMLRQHKLDARARDAVSTQLVTAVGALHATGAAHMRITATRVRMAVGDSVRATLIGFGRALVIDGVEPDPRVDLADLDALLDRLQADTLAPSRPT